MLHLLLVSLVDRVLLVLVEFASAARVRLLELFSDHSDVVGSASQFLVFAMCYLVLLLGLPPLPALVDNYNTLSRFWGAMLLLLFMLFILDFMRLLLEYCFLAVVWLRVSEPEEIVLNALESCDHSSISIT